MPKKRNKNSGRSGPKESGAPRRKRGLASPTTPSRGRRLRYTAIAILSAIPVTLLLSSIGVFRHLEMPALDAQMHLREVPTDSEVMIVRITNDDYQKLFGGKSPLEPSQLQKIINAIARGNPKAIGVDIDTAPPQFQNMQPEPSGPPIIWAREGKYSDRDEKIYLYDVLGGRQPPPVSGLILLKLDQDKVVRRYQRVYETQTGPFPSFAWAMLKQSQPDRASRLEESQNEMLIRFVGGPKHPYHFDLSASKILEHSEDRNWPSNGIMKDKIVLLGGNYAGQDEHNTPLGKMVGVEVLAQMVETELQGGGPKPPGKALIIALGIVAGIGLWSLLTFSPLRISLPLSIPAIFILALLCSLTAFRSFSQWVYFVPILAAVLGQQLFERYKKSRKTS